MQNRRRPTASAILKAAKVQAFLSTDLRNIAYMTGMDVSAGCVLVEPKAITLFVDSRYLEAAKAITSSNRVASLSDFPERLESIKKIGIESEQVTVARLRHWQKKYKKTTFIPTTDVIENFRRSKQKDEIVLIKKACTITKAVLRMVPKLLRENRTEKQLAWELDAASRGLGADGMAFETIVAFGEHTARPHHHPTERKLKKGDIVQVDMGAKFRGYASDYSRVYFFEGKPSHAQVHALRALQKSKKAAEALVRPGVSNRELDTEARKVLKAAGYDKEFCHALGHGLGLDIHEGVTLSLRAPRQILQKNEVITIEPGLYFEGKFGMRIEDTMIV